MSALRILLYAWYAWVSFGLPISLAKKIRFALQEPDRPAAWRAGRVMFFLGILVWCPYVLFAKLLRVHVPLVAVVVVHCVCLYGGLAVQRIAPPAPKSPG
ncbi:MAG: hypothetical protein HY303_05670 [Candidatus Wallbacteria bacterium]|nr:hypothetical protein [Candidatus Wallbacteria bacterium]